MDAVLGMYRFDDLRRLQVAFDDEALRHNLRGTLGVAGFQSVFQALMPVQQDKLRELCGDELQRLLNSGSVISIAYAYPEHAIDAIALKSVEIYDKGSWNIYAKAYHRLNIALDDTADRLAESEGGIAIPATTEGTSTVGNVEEYYGMAVSHRVAAEQSGIGWRGRNELIVHPIYSCAIRLASVVTNVPLQHTPPLETGCGDCRACLDACPFLRYKDRLGDYREQCRRYIVYLNLDEEVCGKCVKACYRGSIYRNQFKLKRS